MKYQLYPDPPDIFCTKKKSCGKLLNDSNVTQTNNVDDSLKHSITVKCIRIIQSSSCISSYYSFCQIYHEQWRPFVSRFRFTRPRMDLRDLNEDLQIRVYVQFKLIHRPFMFWLRRDVVSSFVYRRTQDLDKYLVNRFVVYTKYASDVKKILQWTVKFLG